MTPLSCTAKTLKFTLFIFNLLFLVCGLASVGLGLWLVLDKYAIENLSTATLRARGWEQNESLRDLAMKPTAVRQIGIILLIGGLVVITVAFLGCCGAAKEWRPLLCLYATMLMIILSIEIAAAIYAAMHSHMFEKDFRDVLRASLKMYNGTDTISVTKKANETDEMLVKTAWDRIMIEKSCCGVDSAVGDFNQSGWYHLTKKRHHFPPACCPLDSQGRLMHHCPVVMRHGPGCYAKIAEAFEELTAHFKVVAWTVVSIAFLQVFGIIVGFWLCDSITSDDDIF